MKRFFTLALSAVLLCALALSLASCSAYGKIEKNFLSAEYEIVNTEDENGEDLLSFVAELDEEGKLSCTAHILKKRVGAYAIILEFDANKDAQAKLDKYLTDEDIQNYIKLDDQSKLLRDNCLLIPFVILDYDDSISEMIELFNQ